MEILVVDTETTGLSPSEDALLEIGIVCLDTKTGVIIPKFNVIISESDAITGDEWIFENSDLTLEMVKSGVSLSEIRGPLQELLNSRPVTAFNKKFDFGFLQYRGFTIPKELPCIMLSATDVCKIRNYYGYKWPNVEEAYSMLVKKKYVEAHRALDDAMHEAEILLALIKGGNY
jgi:DNA polymerase-3 subunit epsilon